MKIIIRNNNATDTFNFSFGDPADAMAVGSLVALCGAAGILIGGYGILGVVGGAIFGTGLANWRAQTRTAKAVEDALAEAQAAGEPIFARGVNVAEAPGNGHAE